MAVLIVFIIILRCVINNNSNNETVRNMNIDESKGFNSKSNTNVYFVEYSS